MRFIARKQGSNSARIVEMCRCMISCHRIRKKEFLSTRQEQAGRVESKEISSYPAEEIPNARTRCIFNLVRSPIPQSLATRPSTMALTRCKLTQRHPLGKEACASVQRVVLDMIIIGPSMRADLYTTCVVG